MLWNFDQSVYTNNKKMVVWLRWTCSLFLGVSPHVVALLSGLWGRGCTGSNLCGSAGLGPFLLLSVGTKYTTFKHVPQLLEKKETLLIIYRVKIFSISGILYIHLNKKGSVKITLVSSCLWLKTPAQAGEITAASRASLQKKSCIARYPACMAGDQGDRCLVKHKTVSFVLDFLLGPWGWGWLLPLTVKQPMRCLPS